MLFGHFGPYLRAFWRLCVLGFLSKSKQLTDLTKIDFLIWQVTDYYGGHVGYSERCGLCSQLLQSDFNQTYDMVWVKVKVQ